MLYEVITGDEIERQVVLVDEFLVPLGGVDADAEDDRVLEFLVLVLEIAGFGGAARRHVLRVKIEDDVFLSAKGTELHLAARLVGGGEIRSFGAFFQHGRGSVAHGSEDLVRLLIDLGHGFEDLAGGGAIVQVEHHAGVPNDIFQGLVNCHVRGFPLIALGSYNFV